MNMSGIRDLGFNGELEGWRGRARADRVSVRMDLAHGAAEVNPLVTALCQEALRTGANLAIHQRDEMYEFFFYRNQRDRDRSLAMYIDSGMLIWSTVRQVLEWHFAPGRDPARPNEVPGRDPARPIELPGGNPARPTESALGSVGQFLDFAGGYGRVTRFIAAELGADRVWSAEINPQALEFQQRELGVHVLPSSAAPEAFDCKLRFDAVLVSSLFTHLPRERFAGWMRRLLGLVAPGGLLLFSVHDLALLGGTPPGAGGSMDDGFRFEPESESALLPALEYGSTWVSESFVRSLVAATAPRAAVHRLARGLGNFQDLYLVTPEGGGGARGEPRIERRVDGFVEHCSLAAPRSLLITGWVLDRVSGGPPREVQALVDGVVVDRCDDLPPRPDVMPQFPDDTAMARGWRLIAELPSRGPLCPCRLEIRVTAAGGESMLLYADSVESALLRAVRLDYLATGSHLRRERTAAQDRLREAKHHLQHLVNLRDIRIAALEATIRAMAASRFWKLRNRWFRLKRALGLTAEP
jgi:SAM-dependent methyltransferase